MFWISLAFTYLSECPVNARYYEFTVGMSVVSVTICSISNLLSDYRLSIPYGKLLTKQFYVRFSFFENIEKQHVFSFFYHHWKNKKMCLLFTLQLKTKKKNSKIIIIGAKLGGAAGARAPPLLHNPRNFIV